MDYAARMNKRITVISEEVITALVRHSWPGNVRELQNFIERTVILSTDTVLSGSRPELTGTAPVTLKERSARTSFALCSRPKVWSADRMAPRYGWACRERLWCIRCSGWVFVAGETISSSRRSCAARIEPNRFVIATQNSKENKPRRSLSFGQSRRISIRHRSAATVFGYLIVVRAAVAQRLREKACPKRSPRFSESFSVMNHPVQYERSSA
jgi:hypothetical protein